MTQPAAQGLLPTAPAGIAASVSGDGLTTTNGNLRVTVDPSSGAATFARVRDGDLMSTSFVRRQTERIDTSDANDNCPATSRRSSSLSEMRVCGAAATGG